MKSDYKIFINNLSAKLQKPLPGSAAHQLLVPASRKKYPPDPDLSMAKPSSVLALFYPSGESIQLVFIQRPQYNGVHSGQIAFPGGAYEKTDRDFADTALRETHEEIGVFPDQVNIIGRLTDLYIPPSNFLVHPYVGYLKNEPEFVPDPLEVHEIFSLNVYGLLKEGCFQYREVLGNGYNFTAPCFYLDGRLIWGATSMMLSELLMVIRGIKK